RPAQRESELLLLVIRFDVQFRVARVEGAIAQVIKSCAVKLVGPRFGDHVDYRASSPARLRRSRIRRDPELLNDFIRKLVRCPVAATCLSKERIVVVAAIDQIAGLESADAPEREIAIRG